MSWLSISSHWKSFLGWMRLNGENTSGSDRLSIAFCSIFKDAGQCSPHCAYSQNYNARNPPGWITERFNIIIADSDRLVCVCIPENAENDNGPHNLNIIVIQPITFILRLYFHQDTSSLNASHRRLRTEGETVFVARKDDTLHEAQNSTHTRKIVI